MKLAVVPYHRYQFSELPIQLQERLMSRQRGDPDYAYQFVIGFLISLSLGQGSSAARSISLRQTTLGTNRATPDLPVNKIFSDGLRHPELIRRGRPRRRALVDGPCNPDTSVRAPPAMLP